MLDAKLYAPAIEHQLEHPLEMLREFKFHTVFVSPMRRTLQTAFNLFKNHP
jgi:broad specificity phosphatase PhoE